MDLAKKLKRLREDANLSQKDLAERIGITAQSYNNYEKRDYKPSPEMLVKLAIALKTTPNDLLDFGKESISDIEYAEKYHTGMIFNEDYVNYEIPENGDFKSYKILKEDFMKIIKDAREETENIIQLQSDVTRPALFESFCDAYVRSHLNQFEEDD